MQDIILIVFTCEQILLSWLSEKFFGAEGYGAYIMLLELLANEAHFELVVNDLELELIALDFEVLGKGIHVNREVTNS